MATAEEYAKWIVDNQTLKGTDKFNTVAQAYQEAKAQESLGSGQYESVLPHQEPSTLSKLGQSALKGVTGLVDIAAGAPENYKRLYQYVANDFKGPTPRTAAPTQTYLTQKGVLTPEKEFNTPIGRIADFATQLATQSAITGPLMAGELSIPKTIPSWQALGGKALMTGGQGVLGGAANEFMNETGNTNPLAQALITGGAMAVPGSIYAMRNTPATMVNQSISHLNPQQLKEAQDLVTRSHALGAPITGAEAISQVTGGNKLSAIQRYVENQPRGEGAQIMGEFMDVRPQQTKNMAAKFLREMSPSQVSSMELPSQMAGASENVIKSAENVGNVKANPFYKASENQKVDNSTMVSLFQNPKIEQAVKAVKSNPNYDVVNQPLNTVKTFDAAKRFLNDQYEEFTRQGKDNAARIANNAANQITSNIDVISPQYQQARQIIAENQKNVVEPMKKGTIGQLASTKGYAEDAAAQQRNLLMPVSPKALNPDEISKTVELLKTQNPDIARQWTAQNLQSIFDEAAREKVSGGNQFGGANFVKKVMGNEAQNKNLEALITSSAGDEAWKGFKNMTEVMQAQGQRMPANSATAFNSILTKEMESGGPGAIIKNAKTMGTDLYQAWRLSQNTKMLAKLLTDPESVDKLKELSKTNPESKKALNIVNSVLGGYTAQKPEIGTEENK